MLLCARVEDATEPKKDVVPCAALDSAGRPAEEQYIVQLDVYEGSEIADKGDMMVEICCASQTQHSNAVAVGVCACAWQC